MSSYVSFENESLKCHICDLDTSFQKCKRCKKCHIIWCQKCKNSSYECVGENHFHLENCCDECIPKYGRLIDGPNFTTLYYCPQCAPKTLKAEYLFKKAMRNKNVDIEYLNDSTNW